MSTELAVHAPVKASDQLAAFLGIEKGMMLETLKAQCFPGKRPDEITDTQLAAFVSTANVLQVNPLIPGMLYAYPSKNGGVVPILGPDGTFKKLDEHIATGKLEGFECVVFPEDVTQKPTHAIATIYRKDAKPATYTALFSEWVVSGSPVWGSKPRHMLWTRAIKQAARQVIHGLPMDAEEYAMAEMQNVTPAEDEPKKERPKAPPRAAKGAAAVQENAAPAGKGTVIDAETTPVEAATPAAVESAAGKALAQEGRPVPDAASPAAKAAHAEETAAIDKKAAAVAQAPRAFLKDAEEITAVCEVVAADGMSITSKGVAHPSVQVKLKGGYEGIAYHIGGGVKEGAMVAPAPIWTVGAKVTVRLMGKLIPKTGKVNAFVEAVQGEVVDMEA